jgi:putative tryptophan/tyrosine transport system substrate-binding protein
MRRRELIGLLGSTAVLWPLAGRAQQMPVIGFLNLASPETWAPYVAAFRQGLNDAGYVEGRNVVIEYRWARGQHDRLPALVDELVNRQVAVIVATGSSAPARAAKARTSTIPIVFTSGADPIREGLVTSLARPSGNVTGVVMITVDLEPKRVELLQQFLPDIKTIGALINPKNPSAPDQMRQVEDATRVAGQRAVILTASTEGEIADAFAACVREHVDALHVSSDPIFLSQRVQLVTLAQAHRLPATYEWREFAVAGGLISYGLSLPAAYRQAGIYAGRVLGGAKPADLPVQQPTKLELVINLKTAKALGLSIPPWLLAQADEVIE